MINEKHTWLTVLNPEDIMTNLHELDRLSLGCEPWNEVIKLRRGFLPVDWVFITAIYTTK